MPEKKRPEEIEGAAERVLRELGLGGLVDFALRLPAFKEMFSEVDRQIGERLSQGATGEGVPPTTRFSIRPHVESSYSVRYVREGKSREWTPTIRKPVRKPVQRIVTERPEVEPLVDIFDEKDHLRVVVELPGIEERDIKTELEGSALTISAETKGKRYSKQIVLPVAVMGEPAASCKLGVLELKFKKK